MSNKMHIALRKIRIFHDLKQSELAKKLEVSRSHLGEIELGRKGFSFELLQKYSKVFEIPLSSIIAFAEWLENGDDNLASLSPKIKAMMDFLK